MLRAQKMKKVIGCFAFIVIFCALFYCVNGLLAQKWWNPMFVESSAYQYRELYGTDLSDLQVVFLGTSHMEMAVDPMLLYKDNGFLSFNMASSTQTMEGSCYALEEVFRLSNPQYVFFDVGKLFTSSGRSADRMIFENMQWGLPKLKLIKNWALLADEGYRLQRMVSAFFPIIEYHDRWDSLTEQDLVNESGQRHYYRKGYYPRATIGNTGFVSVEQMNEEAEQKYQKKNRSIIVENGEETVREDDGTGTYELEMSADDQELLMKMLDLCKKHNAQFVLVKIPSVKLPQQYYGAWTKRRSDIVKELAQRINVEYLDLLYDYDLGLDWETDTFDAGVHLNYTGAKKATRFFEKYLEDAGLKSISCTAYDEDMDVYDNVCREAEFLAIQNFDTYIQTIKDRENISILIAAKDDMRNNLSQEDIDLIKKLGIQTQIENMKNRDAFAAVIDNGNVIYEEWSNAETDHEGVLSDGSTYQLSSSGWLEHNNSTIIIDGTDYSCNQRGINIVIYDHESGLVVDSCTFDTWATDKPKATRTLNNFNRVFRDYEEWCMQQGYNPK